MRIRLFQMTAIPCDAVLARCPVYRRQLKPMATELEKVVEQALSLPGLERLSVARRILESVEPEASEVMRTAGQSFG